MLIWLICDILVILKVVGCCCCCCCTRRCCHIGMWLWWPWFSAWLLHMHWTMVLHWHHQWAGSAGNASVVISTARMTPTTVFRKLQWLILNCSLCLLTLDAMYLCRLCCHRMSVFMSFCLSQSCVVSRQLNVRL